ncbi:MAG: PSD1 and planctomycete cytochrome C domain-containing protein [Mariniblastus sp.]|nr:PSD1 and planctomycete cytochrome C domain-containing protein [Mariniblastus sp.]
MPRCYTRSLLFWIATIILVCGAADAGADDKIFSSRQLDFFENKIRPLLVQHCLECHGPAKSENGLRLDSRSAILLGGDSGPAAIAGTPKGSMIIQSVSHSGDYDMPPNKKLADEEIAALSQWISMELPWPAKRPELKELTPTEKIHNHQTHHWAFQPVTSPSIPEAKQPTSTVLDRLVLAKLETKNLSMSPRADQRTLIRRATFDLTGLPPTFEQVEQFTKDTSPDAYGKLINRLLESPAYGERWARHWLDIARYADTSGYTLNNKDNRYPFAFTYRDYVIDAFNNDLPYDEFIREQLAADYLDIPEDKKSLAALGFISVGRKYLAHQDTIDDQVDVVTRGLMGLTVSCARCHDHKYDAIPTEDYYSIYGIFNNNEVPKELPLLGTPKQRTQFQDYFNSLKNRKEQIQALRNKHYQLRLNHIRSSFSDYIAHVIAPGQAELIASQPFAKLTKSEVQPNIVKQWRSFFSKNRNEPTVVKPTLALLAIPDDQFALKAERQIKEWAKSPGQQSPEEKYLNRLLAQPPKTKIELANVIGQLFSETISAWIEAGSPPPQKGKFPLPNDGLAKLVFAKNSPANFPLTELANYLDPNAKTEIQNLDKELVKLNNHPPNGLARAMVIQDKSKIKPTRVMIRGNPHRQGEVAPRRFVAVLSPLENGEIKRQPFKNKSGRLELANRIASPNNPLTARVFVNRVWMHHFSKPLVSTPSDFGIRCPPPVQSELLDFLALEFMNNNWSIKQLHKTIMTSDTYCQASKNRAPSVEVDPENRLLWKMNRRRLEFESLRDSMLAVSQQLDARMHGKPEKLFEANQSRRKTIYGEIDRQNLPGIYRVFDLPNPDQSAAKRTRTTVPQQSLFMINSPFVAAQANHIMKELVSNNERQLDQIKQLYRTLFQREPTPLEIEIGSQYIKSAELSHKPDNLAPLARYAQVLLCTNEFEFID